MPNLSGASDAWWFETGPDTVAHGLQMELIHRERTRYQLLEIYQHDVLGRVLVLDGILQTTERDEFIYNEMLVHVPLLGRREDPAPASVLIIGGGDGGVLREVLRHPWVERAVLVEIDETVVRRCQELLDFGVPFDDPRVELRFEDGAAFVASSAVRDAFDVVVVDSTDPVGPGEILFTPAFICDAAASLKPTGVLARHLCMPFYQDGVFRGGVRRLNVAFPHVQVYQATVPTYPGAAMAFVIAARDGRPLDTPHADFSGRYYNAEVHRAAFALPTWWKELRDSSPPPPDS